MFTVVVREAAASGNVVQLNILQSGARMHVGSGGGGGDAAPCSHQGRHTEPGEKYHRRIP